MNNPLEQLAAIAEGEIGNAESPRGSNTGPQIEKYFRADNYAPNTADNGYAWCAAFVSWCVQQFLQRLSGQEFSVAAPHLAGAFAFRDWGQQNGCKVFTPATITPNGLWPQRGDIVIYTFSHIGIVTSVSASDRNFSAVEGNTNTDGSREGWEVAKRPRVFSAVLCWVRMSPKGVGA